MDIDYQSFADSEPFKFVVGQTGTHFYMHARLAAQLSKPMGTLVEGGMIEAKTRYALFKDTDEDTFVRVIQFAYTGDYAVAESEESDIAVENSSKRSNYGHPVMPQNPFEEPYIAEPPAEEPVEPAPEEPFPEAYPAEEPYDEPVPIPIDDGPDDIWPSTRKKDKGRKRKSKNSLEPEESNLDWADARFSYPLPAIESRMSKAEQMWDSFKSKAHTMKKKSWEPEVNENHLRDYTPVFLCHAKLYAFSDKYSITSLQELVLQKLRLTLSRFKLHPQRVGDVVELLKYTYANTMSLDEKIDKLRNLVTDYLVCHIEKLVDHAGFMNLLDTSDIVKDFLPKLVAQRLD